MILVNKGNFFTYAVTKSHGSASASPNTIYHAFKICLALSGEAVWEIDGIPHRILTGDVVLLNAGQKRHFTSFGKEGFKLCVFTLNRNAFFSLHHFMYFLDRIKNKGNTIRIPELSILLEEIYRDWENESPFYHEFASAKLTEFFLKLERQEGYVVQSVSENYRQMLEIMDYIDENIGKDLSLQAVAKKAGLTESTLSRKFSKVNGISFKQYVVEKKIQRAIFLLQTTNLKMVDVALDSGFDSVSGFYSAFKKKTGTTPNKFYEFEF